MTDRNGEQLGRTYLDGGPDVCRRRRRAQQRPRLSCSGQVHVVRAQVEAQGRRWSRLRPPPSPVSVMADDVACKHTTLHYTRGTASLEAKPVTHSVTGMMARAYSLSSRRARPGERANRVARSPSEWLGKDGGENEGMCKTGRCAPGYSPPRHSTQSTRSTRSTQSMHG